MRSSTNGAPHSETWNVKRETWNVKRETWNVKQQYSKAKRSEPTLWGMKHSEETNNQVGTNNQRSKLGTNWFPLLK